MKITAKKILSISLASFMVLSISTLKAEEPKSNILIQDATLSITKEEALTMLEDMNPVQRERVLTDAHKFKALLIDWLIIKKKAAAAKKLDIDKQKTVQWKIEKVKTRILAEQLIQQYKEKIVPSEGIELLAKDYYDAHPEEFLSKEKVKVAHILLSTHDAKDAESKADKRKSLQKIVAQIKEGKLTFEEAAKKHSDDKGSATSGGIIDYFTRGKMVKPFEEAAFNLKKNNDLSDIIESPFGYHLIKLIDHMTASTYPYDKVKEQLIKEQKSKYIKLKVQAYSDTFRVNKDTTVFQKGIQDLISDAK